MSFFAKNQAHRRSGRPTRLPEGRRGDLPRARSSTLPRRVAAHQPADGALRRRRRASEDAAELSLETIGAFYPIYPLTKGVESWDLQRAITFARSVVDDVPELLPEEVRDRLRPARRPHALDLVHAPDTCAQIEARQRRYRFEEALVTQLVLGRRRRVLRALGAQARTGGDGACWRRSTTRLPFELTDGQREIGAADRARPRPAAPDEPAAPGRGRLRQDPGRAARDAAGRRLRRPGRAARADRGARPAAPPLDHRAARRPGGRRDARRRRRRRPRSSCSPGR